MKIFWYYYSVQLVTIYYLYVLKRFKEILFKPHLRIFEPEYSADCSYINTNFPQITINSENQ